MTIYSKQFMPLLLSVGLSVVFLSCNNNENPKPETAKVDDTAVAVVPPPAPAPKPFEPFDVVEIVHTVKDYATWKPAFLADSVARKASGLEGLVLSTEIGKPNNVMIILKAGDIPKAKTFAVDPRLKDFMQKNGVTSKPDIGYFHVLRLNPDAKENKWVIITHKVKDFDTWLKGFDAEGAETRASYGLYDAALTRGVDDPNLVQVLFDIKDKAKAEARLNDPALKKIMTDAGVVGKPDIVFHEEGK